MKGSIVIPITGADIGFRGCHIAKFYPEATPGIICHISCMPSISRSVNQKHVRTISSSITSKYSSYMSPEASSKSTTAGRAQEERLRLSLYNIPGLDRPGGICCLFTLATAGSSLLEYSPLCCNSPTLLSCTPTTNSGIYSSTLEDHGLSKFV